MSEGRHAPSYDRLGGVLWRHSAVHKGDRPTWQQPGALNGGISLRLKTMARPATAGCVALILAGISGACSSSNDGPQFHTAPGLGCVDDSRQCIDQRQAALRSMMADRDRRWVREPATPSAYASGVRLFAFKSRKKDLSCEELAHGRKEADAGPAILRGPGGAGLTPAQVSRGAMLAAEVSRELGVEMARRCRV